MILQQTKIYHFAARSLEGNDDYRRTTASESGTAEMISTMFDQILRQWQLRENHRHRCPGIAESRGITWSSSQCDEPPSPLNSFQILARPSHCLDFSSIIVATSRRLPHLWPMVKVGCVG